MKIAKIKISSTLQHKSGSDLFFKSNCSNGFFSGKGMEGRARSFFPVAIQPKLKIGQSNDKYEQEADRVADNVVRKNSAFT